MTRSAEVQRVPWGWTFGLLAACLATLIGVTSGLDPDVILRRAVVAGVTLGVLASGLAYAWEHWLAQPPPASPPAAQESGGSKRVGSRN